MVFLTSQPGGRSRSCGGITKWDIHGRHRLEFIQWKNGNGKEPVEWDGKEIWTNRGMGMELKWTRNGNGPGMNVHVASIMDH